MIVDMERSDLSKVCKTGTVKILKKKVDRKSVVQGKSVDLGGRRIIKKKKIKKKKNKTKKKKNKTQQQRETQ